MRVVSVGCAEFPALPGEERMKDWIEHGEPPYYPLWLETSAQSGVPVSQPISVLKVVNSCSRTAPTPRYSPMLLTVAHPIVIPGFGRLFPGWEGYSRVVRLSSGL